MRAPDFWWRESGAAAAVLAPAAFAYGRIAAHRLAQPGDRINVPVICVGNPIVGGAGKTPAAMAIARLLIAMGRKPAFLTRGYGGRVRGPLRVDPAQHRAADVGDEPLLLARVAPTIVARDRLAGARFAERTGADTIVMDDGFQNPSVTKDLSLLVIDARRGIGNGRVFPAGPLRAPLAPQLARAQALLVIGEGSAAAPIEALAHELGLKIFGARLEPDPRTVSELKGQALLAFAGIGDPSKFFAAMRAAGLLVRKEIAFPDHHPFSDRKQAEIAAEADRSGLVPVTTEKDWVRLTDPRLKSRAVALPVRLVLEGEDQFADLVKGAVGGPTSSRFRGA